GKDHLQSLVQRLKGIVDYPERTQLHLTRLSVSRYNPVYFLLSQEVPRPLRQMSYRIPTGMLHRDLHPGNVIIPTNAKLGGSFHVASVEAGLDLARKIQRRSRQRVAFLTAVSRFHYLVETVLKAVEKLPQGNGTLATIYWPGEEPPLHLQGEEEKRVIASRLGV